MDSVWHITTWELTIRVLMALGLGGLVGLEREWSNHAAGLRTHILVCIGSAAIMLLSIYGFSEFVDEVNVRMDPARLAAQVISGIGFLGAGTILRTGFTVSGLTTAASIWVVAAIGLCVGAGFFYVAVLSTILVLLSLFVLNRMEKHVKNGRKAIEVTVKMIDKPGVLGSIINKFGEHGLQIANVKIVPEGFTELDGSSKPVTLLLFSLKSGKKDELIVVMSELTSLENVLSMETKGFKKLLGKEEV